MRESIPLVEGTDNVSRRELNSEILHTTDMLSKEVEVIDGKFDLVNEKFAARDKELIKQALEYERRLTGLNGETFKIQHILEKSIPREVFDNYVREADKIIENLKEYFNQRADTNRTIFDKQIKEISDWKTKQEGSMKVILWFIGIAATVAIGVLIFTLTR